MSSSPNLSKRTKNGHDVAQEISRTVIEEVGTEWDQRGMRRIGRKQELQRRFQFYSITGYAVILSCSWEFAMINITTGLRNGGRAGAIWEVVAAACGMFFATLSFAEMASMAPTAGGQYHWCSEFAPQSIQKSLSYFVAIFCLLGWQTSLAAVCYASAQQITALTTLGNVTFAATPWQTSLISLAVLALAISANIFLLRKLPLIENIVAALHVLAFIAFVALLWSTATHGNPTQVFTDFHGSGWTNTGAAFLIGMTGPAAYLTTADSSVHLAEEVEDAAYVLPRSMIVVALSNYALSFVVVITLVFCLGNLRNVEASPLGQPYLAIFLQAIHSKAGTAIVAVITLILVVSCAINGVTTCSRLMWAFARDEGPPLSRWLSRIHPEWKIPINAIMVSAAFVVVLNVIAIGSEVAYTILISLNVSGLLTSYVLCISSILYRRLYGESLPPSRWRLGRLGPAVNVTALLFLAMLWIFQFFPVVKNPSLLEMNWGCVIYAVVFLASALYYMLLGRFRYRGPVDRVTKIWSYGGIEVEE